MRAASHDLAVLEKIQIAGEIFDIVETLLPVFLPLDVDGAHGFEAAATKFRNQLVADEASRAPATTISLSLLPSMTISSQLFCGPNTRSRLDDDFGRMNTCECQLRIIRTSKSPPR
jgi:hypothetical protein